MRRRGPPEPAIQIQEVPGKPIQIRVRHYGRVPDLTSRFSPEVRLQAVNKLRSRREHAILKAARGLSPMAYKVVEEFLLAERCAQLQHKLDVKQRIATLEERVAREQQGWVLTRGFDDGPYEPANFAEEQAIGPEREADERAADAAPSREKKKPERRERIPERLARLAAERAKAGRDQPVQKLTRQQRKESARIDARLEEDRLSDAREFTPRREHIAERLGREHAALQRQQRAKSRDRSR